jgi:hypothetical protein
MRTLRILGTILLAILLAGILTPIETGAQYRGQFSANPYDPNSTSNPYGRYGSPYRPDSPTNPYGKGWKIIEGQ